MYIFSTLHKDGQTKPTVDDSTVTVTLQCQKWSIDWWHTGNIPITDRIVSNFMCLQKNWKNMELMALWEKFWILHCSRCIDQIAPKAQRSPNTRVAFHYTLYFKKSFVLHKRKHIELWYFKSETMYQKGYSISASASASIKIRTCNSAIKIALMNILFSLIQSF